MRSQICGLQTNPYFFSYIFQKKKQQTRKGCRGGVGGGLGTSTSDPVTIVTVVTITTITIPTITGHVFTGGSICVTGDTVIISIHITKKKHAMYSTEANCPDHTRK